MARPRAFAAAMLATLGSALSCTLLVDTTDLSGGTALGSDGGSDAPKDSSPTESGVDAQGDGGLDATVPYVPCPTTAFFCDDFESGNTNKWKEREVTNGGTLDFETAIVLNGTKSVRMTAIPSQTTDAGSVNAGASLRIGFPSVITNGLAVMRVWLYLPAKLQETATTVAKIRGASSSSDINLKIDSGGNLQFDPDTPNGGSSKSARTPVDVGRWTCIEWRTTLGNPGKSTVLLDGVSVIDLNDDLGLSGGYGEVQLGLTDANRSTTAVVLFDDVAFSDRDLPCPVR